MIEMGVWQWLENYQKWSEIYLELGRGDIWNLISLHISVGLSTYAVTLTNN